MSAQKIPIEFPPATSHATEHGDGVLIHWTSQPGLTTRRSLVLCASVESTRPTPKRMVKYLREDKR